MHRSITKRPLTELQQAMLDAIWSAGPSTSDEIRSMLRPTYDLKDSTSRTLLKRLEERGFLRHRAEGKVYRYEALVQPRGVAARAVQHIIDRFCAGSVEQFLLGMVDERVLTPQELSRLAAKVKRRG
jgi:BlaI family penicillinase repressor